MKVNLKQIVGMAGLGMSLLANTVPTWAGAASANEVAILRSGIYISAGGTMTGVRYSADARQYIGCSLDASLFVRCVASDNVGNFAYCGSYDAKHVGPIQSMTDASSIVFTVTAGKSTCDSIHIYNYSNALR